MPSGVEYVSNQQIRSLNKLTPLDQTFSVIYENKAFDCVYLKKAEFGQIKEIDGELIFKSFSKVYRAKIKKLTDTGNVVKANKLKLKKKNIEQLCQKTLTSSLPLENSIFDLIDASTEKVITSLSNGSIVDLSKINTSEFNIVVRYPETVGSFKIVLNSDTQIDNAKPYSLYGDDDQRDFYSGQLTSGDYTLTATPYSKSNAKGTPGESFTIQFIVANAIIISPSANSNSALEVNNSTNLSTSTVSTPNTETTKAATTPLITAAAVVSKTCPSITQYGITWTFLNPPVCGQFATGDWWVIGPVTITNISPKGTTSSGSMIGPDAPGSWNINHGFDSRIEDNVFVQNLNIATKLPYQMAANKSLISSISSTANTPRYQLSDQAILTTLSSIPDEGSFRPTYFGSDKTIKWNKSQINYSKLSKSIKSSLFNLSDVEGGNIRPLVMLGMKDSYKGTHLIASNNQAYYGGDVSKTNAYAALALNSDLTDAQKEKLAIGFIQKGIDIYEGVVRGNYTVPGGGYPYGYKTPLFFAAVLLNDPNIIKYANSKAIAADGKPGIFAEDRAYYYVDNIDLGARADANKYGLSGGVGCSLTNSAKTACEPGRTIVPYTSNMTGMPEWGNEGHDWFASSEWGTIYRDVTGPNFIGVALAVQLMGAESVWNNQAFFDYMNQRAWPFWSSYYQAGEKENWAIKPTTTDSNGNYINRVDDFIDKAWISTRSPIGTIPNSHKPLNPVSSAWPKGPYPSNYPTYGGPGSVTPPVSTTTYTLTANKAGTGAGNITGNNSPYTSGATATLTATASGGSTFTSWSGCTSTSGATCNVSMTAAKTVTATFTLVTTSTPVPTATPTSINYTLTANKAGTGAGTITGNNSPYTSGATATLTATASSGSTFTSWSGCTSTSGTTCSVSMTAAKTVTATFTLSPVTNTTRPTIPGKIEAENYTAFYDTTAAPGVETTTDVGGGKNVGYISAGEWLSYDVNVTSSGNYVFKARVATIATTGQLISLYVDNVSQGQLTVPPTGAWQTYTTISKNIALTSGNHTIKIVFDNPLVNLNWFEITTATTTPTTYALTANKAGTGAGTITGNNSPYTSGATATLTATASSGSTFTSWSGCTSISGATCSVSMTAAKTVTATFTLVPTPTPTPTPVKYTLTANKAGTGAGTITGNNSPYTSGATATLTATASSGSTFTSWSGCTSTSGATCNVSMNAAKTVTATFTLNPVTPPPSGSGMLLIVHPDNPRYFKSASGKTVYLTGAGSYANGTDEVNFDNYLASFVAAKTNLIRLWRVEEWYPGQGQGPYSKVNNKWDLNSFNQSYFNEMREQVIKAQGKNIYVNIMMFDGWAYHQEPNDVWPTSIWNGNNNNAWAANYMAVTDVHTRNKSLYEAVQKKYVTKVLETLKDLDNVIYEIANEANKDSQTFTTEMLSYTIAEEKRLGGMQHLVGISSSGGGVADYAGITNDFMKNSSASWVSLGQRDGMDLLTNPALYTVTTGKPAFADTDHIKPGLNSVDWPWQVFMRGYNTLLLDDGWTNLSNLSSYYTAFGQTLALANKINLANSIPNNTRNDCSTEYCLMNTTDGQYVVYDTGSSNVTVRIAKPGIYSYTIYDSQNVNQSKGTGTITTTSTNETKTINSVAGTSNGMVVLITKN